jgi:hypothetical protein
MISVLAIACDMPGLPCAYSTVETRSSPFKFIHRENGLDASRARPWHNTGLKQYAVFFIAQARVDSQMHGRIHGSILFLIIHNFNKPKQVIPEFDLSCIHSEAQNLCKYVKCAACRADTNNYETITSEPAYS